MFPGAGASVYYNEAGEPLGWDSPGEPEHDPDAYLVDDFDDVDTDDEPDVWVCDHDCEEFDSLEQFEQHREDAHPDGD